MTDRLIELTTNETPFKLPGTLFSIYGYLRHGYTEDSTQDIIFAPYYYYNLPKSEGVLDGDDCTILIYDNPKFLEENICEDNGYFNYTISYPLFDPYELFKKHVDDSDDDSESLADNVVNDSNVRIIFRDSVFEDYVHMMDGVIFTPEDIENIVILEEFN
jgi:hypothetical protein